MNDIFFFAVGLIPLGIGLLLITAKVMAYIKCTVPIHATVIKLEKEYTHLRGVAHTHYRPVVGYVVDGKEYTNERAIATQQTGFSFVAQLRKDVPDAMRGILWFGTDDANTCVYLPILCNVTRTPRQLGKGDIVTLDWNANFWVNNYVANQAYSRYSRMIPDIRKVQSELETAIALEVKALEQDPEMKDAAKAKVKAQALADKWAEKATEDYKKLGDYLFVKHLDGNVKKEDENGFIYSKDGMPVYPNFPGYDNEEYLREIVRTAGDRLEVKEPQK